MAVTRNNGAWSIQAAVVAVFVAALLTSTLPPVSATSVPTGSKILVVAPHPDDDVLIAAGITSQRSSDVTIAYLTNGESCCSDVPNIGTIRQDEAVAAQKEFLNRDENDLIFLGYPSGNGRLSQLLNNPSVTVVGATERTETYASRGLGGTDYHSYLTGTPAIYNGNNFIADMTTLIETLRPDEIFTTGMFDRHTDHQAAYRVIIKAVEVVNAGDPTYRPTLHSTVVHVMPQAYWGKWPDSVSPTVAHTPIPELETTTGGTWRWDTRESFPVPAAMRNTDLAQNPKYNAIDAHSSQQPDPWLYRFTRRDEIFWSEVLPNSNTKARGVDDTYVELVGQGGTATVPAIGVLGNDVPGNLATKMEAQLVTTTSNGALTLNTDGSFTYTHYGSMVGTDSFTYRPNQGALAGTPATVTITIVLPNVPPVADAGGPYKAEIGNPVVFDGSGSTDSDGSIVSYTWVFGDGVFGSGVAPTHTYASSGEFNVTLTVTDDEGAEDVATTTVSIVDPPPDPDTSHTTGLVDPESGKWYLYDDTGALTTSFFFGNPGDYPFMGDWDGDGVETPGLYRQSDGFVYLSNSNSQGPADIRFYFGDPGDVPLAGDFNGDGFDTVSIYRPSNQTFYIINELGSNDGGLGAAEFSYVFGNPGDKPFVGDFNGDGIETVGLHRESTGLVYFRNVHAAGNADAQFIFGDPGDRIVAGDWNDNGTFTPALFRPSNTTMYFRYTNSQGNADNQFVPVPNGTDWLPVGGRTK